MARRRIAPARVCSGVLPERWDFDQLGDRCAWKGCHGPRDGYLTAIRPADHPVGQLWFAPVCGPCAALVLMKPIPLTLVMTWYGPEMADVASVLNIPEDEVAARLAS